MATRYGLLALVLVQAQGLTAPPRRAKPRAPRANALVDAWRARSAADPRFAKKLALEAALARAARTVIEIRFGARRVSAESSLARRRCALQTAAEVQRRKSAFAREADYVAARVVND